MDVEVLGRGFVQNEDCLMTRGDASGEEKSSRLACEKCLLIQEEGVMTP